MSGISVVDMSDAAPQTAKPFRRAAPRPVLITEEQAADPKILARQLNSIQDQILALQAVAQLFDGAILFLNAVVSTAGVKTILGHNFGRYARWLVVDWSGNGVTDSPILISDVGDTTPTTSTKLLALRSNVAGRAAILVF